MLKLEIALVILLTLLGVSSCIYIGNLLHPVEEIDAPLLKSQMIKPLLTENNKSKSIEMWNTTFGVMIPEKEIVINWKNYTNGYNYTIYYAAGGGGERPLCMDDGFPNVSQVYEENLTGKKYDTN